MAQGQSCNEGILGMIDLDLRKLTDALVKLEGACDQMPQIAQQAQAEALGHAIVGARRNVYETVPGAYQRTQDYLRGFQTSSRATKNTASVTVWNDVDYSGFVEFGTGPNQMTPQQIAAQAVTHPYAPTYLGRSGQKFSLAGPAVIPSSVFALYRMRELFIQEVRKNVKP